MGTSFRMGPGYFPTILSILMIALGAVIAVQALRGPYQEHSFGQVPWRGLAPDRRRSLFFGFVLRGLGLAPAVLIVVLATAWASRYASLRSSLPLSIGLAAFCAVLFIRLLGLPLPLTGPWLSADYWSPASAAHRPQRRHRIPVGGFPHGTVHRSRARLRHGAQPVQPALLLHRRAARHGGRRAARPRPGRHHRHAAADHLRPAAGLVPDHAGRHLLRRPVRRLDHRDPDQPAGRKFVASSRRSTATRWPNRVAPARRSPPPLWAPSSPARWRPSCWRWPPRRWPTWRSSSARRSTSR